MSEHQAPNDVDAELQRAVAPLAMLLRGSYVLVLGSAPHGHAGGYASPMKVVCCNASALRARQLGLPAPVLSVMDNEVLDPGSRQRKPERDVIVRQRLLASVPVGHLVTVQSNRSTGGDPADLGAVMNGHLGLDRAMRARVVQRITGLAELDASNWSMVSTGAFTIALCALLGAQRIHFSGFGLRKPHGALDPQHFYDTPSTAGPLLSVGVESRNHSMADAALVACMATRGFPLDTDDPEFAPLVRNWGAKTPSWAMPTHPASLWPWQ
jgi:hypothetical protein